MSHLDYGIQSPSKYTSLERLEQIQQDNCIGASGKEYSEDEVALMILEKRCLQAEREYLEYIKAEFSQAEQDEIADKAATNGDMILGAAYGVVIIEGRVMNNKTIVKVIHRPKKHPYSLLNYAKSKRYGFNSRKLALQYCSRYLDNALQFASDKAERGLNAKLARQEAKEKTLASIKAGMILSDSWGYDQTNVEFYKVLAVKGTKVLVQELSHKDVGPTGIVSCQVVPGENTIGEPEWRTIGTYGVKINESVKLTLWDGKPCHKSWGY